MTLLPKPVGNCNGINLQVSPPTLFVSRAMNFAVMQSAKRDCKLVAYFHAQRAGLRVRDVMCIRRPATAL